MKILISIFGWLLLVSPVFAQTAAEQSEPKAETFHIQGTIMGIGDHVAATMTLQSDKVTKTVSIDESGLYQADLPIGTYKMKVNWKVGRWKKTSGRPPFRSTTSSNLNLNIETGGSFQPELFKIPAADGTPLEMYVASDNTLNYLFKGVSEFTQSKSGARSTTQVLVEYNVYTLHARHVRYNKKEKTLGADGHVSFEDGSGKTQQFDSVLFKIDNGMLVVLKSE